MSDVTRILIDRARKRHRTRHGIAFQFIEARASKAAIKRRLRVRETSPEEVSDARLEDFAALTSLYQPPVEMPPSDCIHVSTSAQVEKSIERSLRGLSTQQAATSLARHRSKPRPRRRRNKRKAP